MIWNLSSGNILQILKGHNGFIKSLEFSPDGKYLASGSLDRTIILWSTDFNEAKSKYFSKSINKRGSNIQIIEDDSILDKTVRIFKMG